jgi:outer membrane protein assembly factor BamB
MSDVDRFTRFFLGIIVAAGALVPWYPAMASTWPMLGGSAHHQSTSSFLGPETSVLAWKFTTNASVEGGVAIDSDGAVFFGTSNGRFYALEQTGEERWARRNLTPVIGVPAIGAGSRIYVGVNSGTSGTVYALDRVTGAGDAIFTTGSPLVGSPTFDYAGNLLLCTRANGVLAVSSAGTLLWTANLGKIEGTIYVGTADGRLVALEPTGGTRWIQPMARKTTIVGTPTVADDGRIFVPANDGRVRAFDANGTLLWEVATQGAIRGGIALASDGALTFGSDDRKVYRVSPAGAVLWTTLVGGAVASTPVVDRAGTVYVGANDGRVYALGAADGAVRWSFASNGPVRSALAIGVGGRLFAGSSDKRLYALGEFRGGPDCWSNAFVDPNGLSPEEADRRLQTLLAACGGASISSCELQAIGAVNADRVAAAREILAEEITPAQYLALLRDRTRKLAALRQAGVGDLCAAATADADQDLVPDARDACPGTPRLTPTLDNGCADTTLPGAPSAELVNRFLSSFGFAFDPHCDDVTPRAAPVTGLSPILLDETTFTFSFYIGLLASDDQPADCGAFYEIEAFVPRADGTLQDFYMVFPRAKAYESASFPGYLSFLVSSDDPAPYSAFANAQPLDPDARSRIRMRARVTTYAGVRSVWGSF